MIFTVQLTTASSSLGHRTKFFSKTLACNPDNFNTDFYKRYAEERALEQTEKLVRDAKQQGVELIEKSLSLEELLAFVTENSLPVVLINWHVISGEDSYHRHFVPIVGYDEKNVYIHQHGLRDTQEFMPVARDLFDKARKAPGTDEDVMVVYKKS
ncbi:MAG: peptidase C39 family protein [Nanoarchaeota archaeon]|nr:peptidase C39 family protein [Nanoarchaeota archaeon]MBU1051995.1 peptidase C39 family protein [Nanoarchaeota archaeon]MBU1988247.1 peptidase C39 family protein [Nanoarchaeota archaeon]